MFPPVFNEADPRTPWQRFEDLASKRIPKNTDCRPSCENSEKADYRSALGPLGNRALEGFLLTRPRLRLAGQLGTGQALAHDLANQDAETVSIAQRQSVVKPFLLQSAITAPLGHYRRKSG
jgi:hypothetical protein